MTSPALSTNSARSARRFGPVRGIAAPPAVRTSSGPRTRNSTTLPPLRGVIAPGECTGSAGLKLAGRPAGRAAVTFERVPIGAGKSMSTNLRLTSAALCEATQQRCDPIGARCMLPLPNDHFTVADASTPTQRRLAIDSVSLTANRAGVHIDAATILRSESFSSSPGLAILAIVDRSRQSWRDLSRAAILGACVG